MYKVLLWGDHLSPYLTEAYLAIKQRPNCMLQAVITSPINKKRYSWSRPVLSICDFFQRIKRKILTLFVRNRSCNLNIFNLAQLDNVPIFSLSSPELKSEEFLKKLKIFEADFFIFAGYTEIVKPSIYTIPKISSINLHPSLLPKYRGSHPIFWALINGEKEIGMTAMHMDDGIDTGDIILSEKITIEETDDLATARNKVAALTSRLLDRIFNDYDPRQLPRIKQDKALSSYFGIPKEKDYELNFKVMPASLIANMVKYAPGSTYCFIKGNRIYVNKVKIKYDNSIYQPGYISEISEDGVSIQTKEGQIILVDVTSGLSCYSKPQKVTKKLSLQRGMSIDISL